MAFDIVETAIASPAPVVLTLAYPSGRVQADYDGETGHYITGSSINPLYSARGEFSLTFNAADITLTFLLPNRLIGGETLFIHLDRGDRDTDEIDKLRAERVTPQQFGAIGDGVTDDRAAFVAMNAAGGDVYIPKPPVGYTFSSPLELTGVHVTVDPSATWDQITDGGNLTWTPTMGHFTGVAVVNSRSATIHRLSDRVFIGHAADHFAGTNPEAGASWLNSATDGPHYVIANSKLVVMSDDTQRRYAIAGAVTTTGTAGAGEAIAVGAVFVNDGVDPNHGSAWGLIVEGQHETTTKRSYGIEIALKNASGIDSAITPYSTATNSTFGILLAGGGDDAFGPAATDPCTAGIVFTTNNSTGWNTGIQFRSGAITGAEPEAIALANGHALKWYEGGGNVSAVLKSTNNTTSKLTLQFQSGAVNILNNAGKSVFFFSTTATAVNRINFIAAAASADPIIEAAGDDTDIDLLLRGKGAGFLRFGTHSAIGAETVTGYITIKDSLGTQRKIAVVS